MEIRPTIRLRSLCYFLARFALCDYHTYKRIINTEIFRLKFNGIFILPISISKVTRNDNVLFDPFNVKNAILAFTLTYSSLLLTKLFLVDQIKRHKPVEPIKTALWLRQHYPSFCPDGILALIFDKLQKDTGKFTLIKTNWFISDNK